MPDLFIDHRLRPAFYDLDPMAIVWHGHYLKYFELARDALLSQFNYSYHQMLESGYVWPVVDVRLKYVKSAKLNQWLNVRASVAEFENRLKIDYRISDVDSGEKLTEGYTIQVAVEAKTERMLFVCPPILWERLGVAP